MRVNRGDVVLVDYPFTTGGAKVRPALVVQKEIVRHSGTGLSLFDNSLSHRAGNLGEKPTDLLNRGHVLALQLTSATVYGLVIDQILRHGHLVAARPGLIVLLEAAHRLLQDGLLGREVTALDFLADKVAEIVGERDIHRSNPFW